MTMIFTPVACEVFAHRSFRVRGFLLSALKVVRGPKWGINDCVA